MNVVEADECSFPKTEIDRDSLGAFRSAGGVAALRSAKIPHQELKVGINLKVQADIKFRTWAGTLLEDNSMPGSTSATYTPPQ